MVNVIVRSLHMRFIVIVKQVDNSLSKEILNFLKIYSIYHSEVIIGMNCTLFVVNKFEKKNTYILRYRLVKIVNETLIISVDTAQVLNVPESVGMK